MAAITEDNYLGNGSSKTFGISFEYLEETDVKVSLDGVNTTEYIFANATQITFNTAPATNVKIRIYRVTNNDSSQSTFFAGSAIRAQDLNRNFTQNLFSVQEISARSVDATQASFTNDVNLNSNKITNLAQGTESGDAVNRAQLDATQNHNDTQLANSVSQANTARTAAETAQSNAEDARDAAQTARDAAQTAAGNAEDSADTAAQQAAAAATSASNAATFTADPIFYGLRRTDGGELEVHWSTATETDVSYNPVNFEYKSQKHWFIGTNGLLHTAGANIGQPKFSINAAGHVIIDLL